MRQVAIVGTAPSSIQLAPFDNPEWEIWTCSANALAVPRWDRHFELHDGEEIARGWTNSPEGDHQARGQYLRALAAAEPGQSVVLKERDPAIPQSRSYPYVEACEWARGEYFASTVSYMLAMAVLEGVERIGIWGVDMALQSEQYSGQRGSLEYLIGLARGQGVEVTVPPESDLLKILEPYAFGASNEFGKRLKAKRAEINQRLAACRQQKRELEGTELALAGAADVMDWVSRSWAHE